MKPTTRKRLRWAAGIFTLIVVALLTKFVLHLLLPRNVKGTGEHLPLALKSGAFETLYYCDTQNPKGIVIVGSGDGGWSYWEERLSKHAAAAGYAVGGWDCRKFADSREFTHADLVEGFNQAVAAVRDKADADDDAPVFYTGWSTGAEWAVAAAADKKREPHLLGILPAAPGDRSRYGITKADLLGLPCEGPGSFALAELAPDLGGVAIAQFAAGLDPMDDVTWLDKLGPETPHKVFEIPMVLHDMGGAGDKFLATFDQAIEWIIQQP
jgi:pimeloyl-ACP methyl ester carboxylesterase